MILFLLRYTINFYPTTKNEAFKSISEAAESLLGYHASYTLLSAVIFPTELTAHLYRMRAVFMQMVGHVNGIT